MTHLLSPMNQYFGNEPVRDRRQEWIAATVGSQRAPHSKEAQQMAETERKQTAATCSV